LQVDFEYGKRYHEKMRRIFFLYVSLFLICHAGIGLPDKEIRFPFPSNFPSTFSPLSSDRIAPVRDNGNDLVSELKLYRFLFFIDREINFQFFLKFPKSLSVKPHFRKNEFSPLFGRQNPFEWVLTIFCFPMFDG